MAGVICMDGKELGLKPCVNLCFSASFYQTTRTK
jgi:hypothetical protein